MQQQNLCNDSSHITIVKVIIYYYTRRGLCTVTRSNKCKICVKVSYISICGPFLSVEVTCLPRR
jgi:hypothetical protein